MSAPIHQDASFHLRRELDKARARLAAADALANAVDRRMNDLGGYDDRFNVRAALNAYRATAPDDPTEGDER